MVHAHEHDGDRLRLLMARAGISQAALAEHIGVSPTAVGSKWLAKGEIARQHIARVCALLDCMSDELLGLSPLHAKHQVKEQRAPYERDRTEQSLLAKVRKLTPKEQAALLDLIIAMERAD